MSTLIYPCVVVTNEESTLRVVQVENNQYVLERKNGTDALGAVRWVEASTYRHQHPYTESGDYSSSVTIMLWKIIRILLIGGKR